MSRSLGPIISLVCTISKVFQKIALRGLLSHQENKDLLTSYQHGFRKGKSTIIIDAVETIIDSAEEGATITGVLLDFSKAFDSPNHNHLMDKLRNLGVREVALQWFQSYLTGRSLMTEIRGLCFF